MIRSIRVTVRTVTVDLPGGPAEQQAGPHAQAVLDPSGHVLRMASDGSLTDLGPTTPTLPRGFNAGALDDSGNFWIGSKRYSTLYKVDIATMSATPLMLGSGIVGDDITYAKGAVWTVVVPSGSPTVTHLRRIDLSTGKVSGQTSRLGTPAGAYGAGFTYGNGDVGFISQGAAKLYRLGPIAKPAKNPVTLTTPVSATASPTPSSTAPPSSSPSPISSPTSQPPIVPSSSASSTTVPPTSPTSGQPSASISATRRSR